MARRCKCKCVCDSCWSPYRCLEWNTTHYSTPDTMVRHWTVKVGHEGRNRFVNPNLNWLGISGLEQSICRIWNRFDKTTQTILQTVYCSIPRWRTHRHTLIDRSFVHIVSKTGELRQGVHWGTRIHQWIKYFVTCFSHIVWPSAMKFDMKAALVRMAGWKIAWILKWNCGRYKT